MGLYKALFCPVYRDALWNEKKPEQREQRELIQELRLPVPNQKPVPEERGSGQSTLKHALRLDRLFREPAYLIRL